MCMKKFLSTVLLAIIILSTLLPLNSYADNQPTPTPEATPTGSVSRRKIPTTKLDRS